jgi:hypothetical protein
MMSGAGRKSPRQVLLSSHSVELLSDRSIAPEEVLLLKPTEDGTQVVLAADDEQIRLLLEGGLTVADAVIPRTAPQHAEQLILFQ